MISPAPTATPRNATQPAPLTHAQESLYFLDQLTNGLPVYHMPQAFRLRGPLNIRALEAAFGTVAAWHPALQLRISEGSSGPEQFTAAPGNIELQPETVAENELGPGLQQEISRRFDLSSEPPLRVRLYRLGPDDHVLLMVLHHIAGDMTSLGILFRDLALAYQTAIRSAAPELPPVEMGLLDYAREQRSENVSEETRRFWRGRLKDYTGELDFPLDKFRPRLPSFRGAAHYFEIPRELVEGLNALARKNKCSVYMVSLAALQALAHRYTGQERFCIATPFSDREDPRLENTIGYLINLLPLPCEVHPGQRFTGLLHSVRASCLEVYEHHRISFRSILQELNVPSESPKPPLARLVFQYFPERAALDLAGLSCSRIEVHSGTSKFDLCFSLWEQNGSVTAEIEYDSDLFEQTSIRRLGKHYLGLLRSIVAHPERPVSELDLMNAEERSAVLAFGTAERPYPREATVHSLFEEQARQTPDAIALRFGAASVTYAELDRRSNQFARYLSRQGVQPGDMVGVCLDRSVELIVALIAILKSGAAFVPFDANYPRQRLDYLFADSGVRLLVTDSLHAQIAPAGKSAVLVDRVQDAVSLEESSSLHAAVSAESPAYIMYTSGSTGEPKGAVIPHRAIVRLVKNTNFLPVSPDQVFLAFAPVSFDASTLEIWGPLLNGATLAIYPPRFESVEQFGEVIQRCGVTTLWLTAGLFNTIVDQNLQALRGVKHLLAGGDVLSVAHIRKAQAALPETIFINGYGPTENTTFTCCYTIPKDWPAERSIPIGRPVANTQVLILDERLQPVPIGVPGNLYAGGDGLALGYWNKPDLTARSFVADPFDQSGRKKLYRTGDRARFLEDGTIEFLGRRDSQVKIRGFRIELGEIESALRRLEGVQDAAAVVRSDSAGGKTLLGYVVLKQGAQAEAASLQEALAALLPSHACPSRILILPELPLGPNGKVNRNALPAPDESPAGASAAPEAASPTEERLLQIWKEILELPRVHLDDNFFHLGGESLRATRALSQINRAFNCRLGLPRLFEAPTVRQMARVVEKAISSTEPAPIKPRSTAPLPRTSPAPDLGSLTEEEVDSLLKELLASNDTAKS